MSCNFPELLAHDLDAPNPEFATKKMSAGAPSVFSMSAVQDLIPMGEAGLHLIDDPASVCLDEEGYSPAPGPEIRYFPLSHQPTLLEPIDELPADGATHDGTSIAHHVESDWDSLSSSSHPSSTMELQPAMPQDASVVTTATSMGSRPLSGLANKGGFIKSAPDVSWIDIDVDSDSEEPPCAESPRATPVSPLRSPLRRQPVFCAEPDTTPNREIDTCPDAVERVRSSAALVLPRPSPRGDNYTLHSGRVSKRFPARRRGVIRFAPDENYLPSSPTSIRVEEIPSTSTPTPPGTPPYTSPVLASRQLEVVHDVAEVGDEVLEIKAVSSPLPTSPRSGSCPEEDPAVERQPTKHSTDSYRGPDVHREHPSSPRPPMPSNIQTWIETSQDAATKPDDQPPGIPLPPDVVDNLRISIACFPDTTLLTSSLSIETIRSYSRKVKTCPPDLKRDLPPPPAHSPRKWGFSRILSSRRSNASSCGGSRDSNEEAPVTPWTGLRAVFPSGSEYLCDALYAHIVAYNYISALPRGATASPPKTSSRGTDEGEVPRKAAALLGLREPDASSVDTARTPPSARHGPSEKRDGALKDLLVGLSRCIGRLVTTLKEGRGEVMGEESSEVDLFLVRALCEVVRCSEER